MNDSASTTLSTAAYVGTESTVSVDCSSGAADSVCCGDVGMSSAKELPFCFGPPDDFTSESGLAAAADGAAAGAAAANADAAGAAALESDAAAAVAVADEAAAAAVRAAATRCAKSTTAAFMAHLSRNLSALSTCC